MKDHLPHDISWPMAVLILSIPVLFNIAVICGTVWLIVTMLRWMGVLG